MFKTNGHQRKALQPRTSCLLIGWCMESTVSLRLLMVHHYRWHMLQGKFSQISLSIAAKIEANRVKILEIILDEAWCISLSIYECCDFFIPSVHFHQYGNMKYLDIIWCKQWIYQCSTITSFLWKGSWRHGQWFSILVNSVFNFENVLLTFKWYVFMWQKCSMLTKYANCQFFNKWKCVSMP